MMHRQRALRVSKRWLRYEVRLKRNFNYSFGQAPSLCVHSVYTAIGGNLRYGGGLVILHKWPDK